MPNAVRYSMCIGGGGAPATLDRPRSRLCSWP
jgi:hypothetical protein